MDPRFVINITAEDFASSRFELPDNGRWCELVDGRVLVQSPPSTDHGLVVMNFAKALARYLERNPEGYACFELGLIVARQPDWALFPAVSYFVGGRRFEELDKAITEARPTLILEVISTAERRRTARQRVTHYLKWGVAVVIVADPDDRRVVIHLPNDTAEVLKHGESLTCRPTWWAAQPTRPFLQEFQIEVAELFREPEWAQN